MPEAETITQPTAGLGFDKPPASFAWAKAPSQNDMELTELGH